jgi:hypothetical protein
VHGGCHTGAGRGTGGRGLGREGRAGQRAKEMRAGRQAYAGVVQSEYVAVTVFEGRDQALEVGHVVGELRRMLLAGLWSVAPVIRISELTLDGNQTDLVQHRLHFLVR